MRLLILLLLCNYGVFAQYCGTATTNVSITPSTTVQYSSTYSSGIRAFTFNAVAGNEYIFSTVGQTTVDTYLRLYSGSSVLAESDDYNNTQSEISWYCSTSGTYSVLLTRAMCTSLNANAKIKYVMTNNAGSSIVTIGTGIGYVYQVPVNHYYRYGWSEMIYLKSEINTLGSITKIRFQVNPTLTTIPYVAENQKIYMAHTTYSALPSVSVKEDAKTNYASSNYMLVYSGTINWNIGWVEITLQTPFPYNNVDNLLIKYENREGTYSLDYPMFYYTSKTATVGYFHQDASYPTVNGTRDGFRPNIKLVMSNLALPVELMSINGYNYGKNNSVIWITASENGCSYYDVEKSVDGVNWHHVGTLNGDGYTNEQRKYVFDDYEFREVINYYRVKQYDFDGEFDILGIVAIDNSDKKKYIIGIYDVIGREVSLDCSGFKIIVYSDGSTVSIFN